MPIGVGLTYHPFVHRYIVREVAEFDFLEIAAARHVSAAQQCFDRGGVQLSEITRHRPCIVRSDMLSIGSVEPPDSVVVAQLREFLDRVHAAGFVELLAFNRLGERSLAVPQALLSSDVAARWIATRYQAMAKMLGTAFLLEIPLSPAPPASADCTEADFINRVAECTDCALSLDLTALFVNSRNGGHDALRFVRELPAERIAHLRIGGVREDGGQCGHDACKPVSDEVFDLLDATLALTAADTVTLERNGGYFPFANVIAEVQRARQIFARRREHIPERRHFAAGQCAADVAALPDDFGELDDATAALRDYQSTLIERLLPADAGHAVYLRDYFRQQQMVAWALRDAGTSRWQ